MTSLEAALAPLTVFGRGEPRFVWSPTLRETSECVSSVSRISIDSKAPGLAVAFQGRSKCCGSGS